MRARLIALLLLLAALAPCAAAAPAPGPILLGLGDSLAFGYQPWRNVLDADSFHTGFVDDLAVRLRTLRPDVAVVNYACPGETTVTFLAGGCTYNRFLPLHDDYPASTPQLDEAVALLRAHPGEVSRIVISIGANDLNGLARSCGTDAGCVAAGLPPLLGRVGANLDAILAALHEAAPAATVVLLAYYDPYAAADPTTVAPVQALDAVIAAAAAVHGDRVADAFTPFNVLPPQPQRLCSLTFMCGLFPDIHPTDDGYLVIADAFFAAGGFLEQAGGRAAP